MDAPLPPHFFRHESGRLVAALTRVFGLHNLALAEDVTQDTLCRALELWRLHGTPANPSAWLITTARNRAIDVLRREKTARTYAPELGRLLDSEWTLVPVMEDLFQTDALKDDELRMIFSLCDPRLAEEAQVGLVLHLLCGFSVDEVAAAYFTAPSTIEKRLWRAKRTLADSHALFELGDADFAPRLASVLRAIYLLFNEGYHGASPESAVREELCREALRLIELLSRHPLTGTPATHALGALLFLHAARIPARVSAAGQLRSLFDQDRGAWDATLIAHGLALLSESATGDDLTPYHIEAIIAAHHASATRREDTPWAQIVSLYDLLLAQTPSPVVALNRAIAFAELHGAERGLEEIFAIEGRERLASYPFYEAALGELFLRAMKPDSARVHFASAISLARSPMEQAFFEERLAACEAALRGAR